MNKALANDIGQRLREARKALGLTQKALSMPTPSIKDYESGKSVPGGLALMKFADMGININWLLTGKGVGLLPHDKKDCEQLLKAFDVLQGAAFTARRLVAQYQAPETHSQKPKPKTTPNSLLSIAPEPCTSFVIAVIGCLLAFGFGFLVGRL